MLVNNELIERATSFPINDVVERYASDENLTIDAAREHEIELKRYLALCAAHPEKSYGMFGPIDKFWHTFIIFTKEYEQFCQNVAGRFIHHIPSDSGDRGSPDMQHALYSDFLLDYQVVFGEEAPHHLWPRFSKMEIGDECSGCKGCSTPS